MLPKMLERGIEGRERAVGIPLEYLRHVARHSPAAVWKLGLLGPLEAHRHALPLDALHVARLQATLDEDCGDSVQVELNLARRDGVPREVLRAVVAQQPEDLPEHLSDVARFAWAVGEHASDAEKLRERIRERYGEEGLIEISLAIASARVFPTLRRALGFSRTCAETPLAIKPRAG